MTPVWRATVRPAVAKPAIAKNDRKEPGAAARRTSRPRTTTGAALSGDACRGVNEAIHTHTTMTRRST